MDVICCPLCQGDLSVSENGTLKCRDCGTIFPIVKGIPNLITNLDRDIQDLFDRRFDKFQNEQGLYASNLPSIVTSSAYKSYQNGLTTWLDQVINPSNKIIADIGCGTGNTIAKWAKENSVYGIDISLNMLQQSINFGLRPVAGSRDALPLKNNSFDIVCAFGIIVYSNDINKTLANLKQRLKPGGHIIIAAAVNGGVRSLTRPLLNAIRGKNIIKYIPSYSQLLTDIESADFLVKSRSGICWPIPLKFKDNYFSTHLTTTAFILAQKK